MIFAATNVTTPNPARHLRRDLIAVARCLRQLALEDIMAADGNLVRFFAANAFEFEQMLEITLADRLPLLDRAVHSRLCKRWLVAFVVPEPAVAVHIDHNVTLEHTPEVHRELDRL